MPSHFFPGMGPMSGFYERSDYGVTPAIRCLYPSARSAFAFVGEDKAVSASDIKNLNYRDGKVSTAAGFIDGAQLQTAQVYAYRLDDKYYGMFRVESVKPNLVISFVTYEASG